jgi:hypothetical protein
MSVLSHAIAIKMRNFQVEHNPCPRLAKEDKKEAILSIVFPLLENNS